MRRLPSTQGGLPPVSLAARQNRSNAFCVASVFLFRDSNPERVSDVKKTVLWTVFSREV